MDFSLCDELYKGESVVPKISNHWLWDSLTDGLRYSIRIGSEKVKVKVHIKMFRFPFLENVSSSVSICI